MSTHYLTCGTMGKPENTFTAMLTGVFREDIQQIHLLLGYLGYPEAVVEEGLRDYLEEWYGEEPVDYPGDTPPLPPIEVYGEDRTDTYEFPKGYWRQIPDDGVWPEDERKNMAGKMVRLRDGTEIKCPPFRPCNSVNAWYGLKGALDYCAPGEDYPIHRDIIAYWVGEDEEGQRG